MDRNALEELAKELIARMPVDDLAEIINEFQNIIPCSERKAE